MGERGIGPFEFDSSLSSWRSLALSLALHSIVLVIGVLLWKPEVLLKSEPVLSVEVVLADVAPQNATQYLEALPNADPNAGKLVGEFNDMLPLSQPAPSQDLVNLASAAATNTGAPNLDAGAMIQPTGATGFSVGGGGEFTAAELSQIAAERQRLEGLLPRGEPATIRVFGSGGLVGRKFVFLIDRSKSMGDEGLGVIERANAELQTALSQLTSDHEFQVIAYHHETTMIDHRALLPATTENRQKVSEFIQNLAAFGGTEHESGLIAALALKPDIVVVLTDGGLPEMNSGQLATIRRMANKNTQVHCLHFGNGPAPSSTFMTTLAQENRGTYKYIDVSTWK